MTQRRRIAISYLFAVPIVVAIVLVQQVALRRLRNAETEMAQTAEYLYQSQADRSLQQEPEGKGGRHAQSRTASGTQGQNPAAENAKTGAENRAAQGARLLGRRETSERAIHFATAVNTFGGVLAIWLVSVAAFLLFHDEKTRAWSGMERRVHTRIIETLPLGVCLSTAGGSILYSNSAEETIFGHERGELIGKDVARLHAAADPNLTVEKTIDRLGPGQIWSGEVAIKRKDGATPKVQAWIMNVDVAGKLYRLFVHSGDTALNAEDLYASNRSGRHA